MLICRLKIHNFPRQTPPVPKDGSPPNIFLLEAVLGQSTNLQSNDWKNGNIGWGGKVLVQTNCLKEGRNVKAGAVRARLSKSKKRE